MFCTISQCHDICRPPALATTRCRLKCVRRAAAAEQRQRRWSPRSSNLTGRRKGCGSGCVRTACGVGRRLCTNTNAAWRLVQLRQQHGGGRGGWGYHMPAGTKAESGGAGGGSVKEEITPGASHPPTPSPPTTYLPQAHRPPFQPRLLHIKVKGLISKVT